MCVQRWKGKKTYDNKTGEHTGGPRPMFYTSKLINYGSRESQSAMNMSGLEHIQENKSGSERTSQQERKVAGNTAMREFRGGLMEVQKIY